jgi:hypothetical protein
MFNKKITQEAQLRLRSLIGQQFSFVGGVNLPDYLVSDSLIVETSSTSVSIYGDTEEQALGQGSSDDFAFFVIGDVGDKELETIHKSGNMYLLDKRSRITDIFVIRDFVSVVSENVTKWQLEWDSAIVIGLETGFVAISFLSLGAEALRVDFLDELALEMLPLPSSGYENSLLKQYNSRREIVSLGK